MVEGGVCSVGLCQEERSLSGVRKGKMSVVLSHIWTGKGKVPGGMAEDKASSANFMGHVWTGTHLVYCLSFSHEAKRERDMEFL